MRTPRRSYLPSGPWIDGIRPVDAKSSTTTTNPDPLDYRIIKALEIGRFLIVQVNYPNCTNFEGNKILMFSGITLIDLVNQKCIDPHFFQDEKLASPIARFIPTDAGWDMAIKLANALDE